MADIIALVLKDGTSKFTCTRCRRMVHAAHMLPHSEALCEGCVYLLTMPEAERIEIERWLGEGIEQL